MVQKMTSFDPVANVEFLSVSLTDKNSTFWLPGNMRSEPHRTWHVIEDLKHVLAAQNVQQSDAQGALKI